MLGRRTHTRTCICCSPQQCICVMCAHVYGSVFLSTCMAVGVRKSERERETNLKIRSFATQQEQVSMVHNYSIKSSPVDRLGQYLNSACSHYSQFTSVQLQFCSVQSSTSVEYFSSVQFQRAINYQSLSTTSTVTATRQSSCRRVVTWDHCMKYPLDTGRAGP